MRRPFKGIDSLPSEKITGLLQDARGNVSQSDVLRFYATSQTVYSIVNTRAENVAMPTMRVVDENGKPIPGHPLSSIFSKRSNYQEVMKRTEFSLSLTGHALIVPNPNLLGMFDGMHNLIALSPRLYRRDGDSYRGLRGFFVTPNAYVDDNYLTPDEALYLYGISPFDDFDGTSPAEAAANAAGVQKELFDTQWSYFQNRMIDGTFLQPAATTNPNARQIDKTIAEALQKVLQRFGIGAKNAGLTHVVQDRWEPVNMQADFAKIAAQELSDTARLSICEAFQFPMELLTFKDSNFAQSKEAVAFWRESWLKPRCRWYAQQFAVFFTEWYDRPVYVEPDFSGIDQEDDTARIDRAQKRSQAMFIDLHTAAIESGVKEPLPELKGLILIQGIPVPAVELPNYWKTIKGIPADTGVTPALPAVTGQPAPETTGVPPALPDPTKALGEPLFVGLSLAGDGELVGLQRRLMSMHPDPAVKWTPPDDYHLTVLYAEAVDPEIATQFCEDLKALALPDLRLRVGQLNTFDNLGEHALHFRVGRDAALKEYQATVYDLAQEYGIACSQYSNPDDYTPHITMAYLPEKTPRITFHGKLKVSPKGVWCDHGEKTLWRSWEAEEAPVKSEPQTAVKSIRVPAAVYKEIATATGKAFKGMTFTPKLLTDHTVTYINAMKGFGFGTAEVIEAAKAHYLGLTAAKALTDTRSRFDNALVELFQKDIKKTVFISRMDVLLERYCRQALIDGFSDGGVEDINPDDPEDEDMVAALVWLKNHIDGQKQYVRNVADVLFSDESLSDDEIEQNKPLLWWNKSITPVYNYGLHQASGDNALGIFELGPTEKHCQDCPALDGIAVTFKKWLKYFDGQLPPCSATECGGWRCLCKVKPYRGKKYRGTLPVLHGHAPAA